MSEFFVYEQFLIIWKITFITLSDLPCMLLFLLRTCVTCIFLCALYPVCQSVCLSVYQLTESSASQKLLGFFFKFTQNRCTLIIYMVLAKIHFFVWGKNENKPLLFLRISLNMKTPKLMKRKIQYLLFSIQRSRKVLTGVQKHYLAINLFHRGHTRTCPIASEEGSVPVFLRDI